MHLVLKASTHGSGDRETWVARWVSTWKHWGSHGGFHLHEVFVGPEDVEGRLIEVVQHYCQDVVCLCSYLEALCFASPDLHSFA